MRSSKSRSRSKTNRNRPNGASVVNRVFDSSGPEGKVRGTPQQIIDKYNQLARDAQLSNDRVATENFQQHAEHYLRMLNEAQREIDARRDEQERQNRERQAERDRERAERPERQERPDRPERNEQREQRHAPSERVERDTTQPAPAPAAVTESVPSELVAVDPREGASSEAANTQDSGLVDTPEGKSTTAVAPETPAKKAPARKPRSRKPAAPAAANAEASGDAAVDAAPKPKRTRAKPKPKVEDGPQEAAE